MTRMLLSALLIISAVILVGCHDANTGRGQLLADSVRRTTDRREVIETAKDKETDIIEQMSMHRREYRQHLQALIKHYRKAGDYMKRQWAEKELAALDAIPQYSYIIEAQLAGPDLRATEEIPEADDLYYQALVIEEGAKKLLLLKNKEKLRIALDKYNKLIRDYPTSDKIDDAAYRAGRIYEGFKDYSIALLYYQRAYQWNPDTSYPARYRSADVLDKRMHRRSEAVELYEEALDKDKLTSGQREAAKERIDDYTKSGEKTD